MKLSEEMKNKTLLSFELFPPNRLTFPVHMEQAAEMSEQTVKYVR